jgi:hypothetical protein
MNLSEQANHGAGWNEQDIRRSMRVLGSQQARVGDAAGCARALRLVGNMLERRGMPAELFQAPGVMPLLVAGSGPVLLIAYLDDPNQAQAADDQADAPPPRIAGDVAIGEGVVRKAGVLAACSALLSAVAGSNPFTLIVEADRHAGSLALEAWLRVSGRRFGAALWEVVDLPLPAPILFRASNGVVRARIQINAHTRPIENLYAGVLPDAGHLLANALAAMKSTDLEVLLPRFYDDVAPPSDGDLHDVQEIAGQLGEWLAGAVQEAREPLTSNHLALGVFCAPALFVRDLQMRDAGSFISGTASATIEARILPGQSPAVVARAITDFMQRRLPGTQVETLYVREPARGTLIAAAVPDAALPVLPIGPGASPAGMLEGFGAATAGYAVVRRDAGPERVALPNVSSGAQTLGALGALTAAWLATRA